MAKKSPNIWATFEGKFVINIFQKSPNLVKNWNFYKTSKMNSTHFSGGNDHLNIYLPIETSVYPMVYDQKWDLYSVTR